MKNTNNKNCTLSEKIHSEFFISAYFFTEIFQNQMIVNIWHFQNQAIISFFKILKFLWTDSSLLSLYPRIWNSIAVLLQVYGWVLLPKFELPKLAVWFGTFLKREQVSLHDLICFEIPCQGRWWILILGGKLLTRQIQIGSVFFLFEKGPTWKHSL